VRTSGSAGIAAAFPDYLNGVVSVLVEPSAQIGRIEENATTASDSDVRQSVDVEVYPAAGSPQESCRL
jgi:hypothetical protein